MTAPAADNSHPAPAVRMNVAGHGGSPHAVDVAAARQESAPGSGYLVRVCDVFGTSWRIPRDLPLRPLSDFTLTNAFRDFYIHQQGLPKLLNQEYHRGGAALSVDGSAEGLTDLVSVEVVLFALPIPVNQVVAAVVVDFREATIGSADGSRIRLLLDAMVSDEVRLHLAGRSVLDIVNDLARSAGAERVDQLAAVPPQAATRPVADGYALRLEEERHLLVFAYPDPNDLSVVMPANLDREARTLINEVHWPHEPEFTTIRRPRELNGPARDRDDRRYAAISHYASVLYGQSGAVNASALLIAAQTVGTAARFQLIWGRASQQVEDFQREKQKQGVGQQTRESLAPLADEMGNLELDLTFNVQTAADLGLGSTTAFVDSFQTALHDVMKFRNRADTVADMFQRVNSSIQSELTAIISRERDEDEKRRREEEKRRQRGAAIIGALSFILAPLTVIFGFFGVSTADVADSDHVYDIRKFWLVYAIAMLLTAVAVTWALVMVRAPKSRTFATPDPTETPVIRRRRRRGRRRRDETAATTPGALDVPR